MAGDDLSSLGRQLWNLALVSGSEAKLHWRQVAQHALRAKDPWESLARAEEIQRAVEHTYDPDTDKWLYHTVLVKINLEHRAGKGAMRECFKMKIKRNPTERDVEELTMSERSIVDELDGIGRRTALRIRQKLGLKQVAIHHKTILTLGELFSSINLMGEGSVRRIFKAECHSWGSGDMEQFDRLVQRNQWWVESWSHASLNCMAKRYMDQNTDPKSYKDDIIMQATSKLLCDQFNDLQPPKSIDMLRVGLLELVDAVDQPLLAYEAFVPGEYMKWNTNTGWVEDGVVRHTPQAFSFVSFRLSGGTLMVVDIQGVDDLYTDPQIHSYGTAPFGEGDLGIRGMALFLRSFRYELNPVVQYLRVCPFIMAPGEHIALAEDDPQVVRAAEGRAYLDSEEWKKRARVRGSRRCPSLHEGENGGEKYERRSLHRSYSSLLASQFQDATPFFLQEIHQHYAPLDCPAKEKDMVPKVATTEGLVHEELASLYEAEDDRVTSLLGACTIEEAAMFHHWLAAVGGCRSSMIWCAKKCEQLSRGKEALAWLDLAATRGSEEATLKALELIPRDDHILNIFYLQLALDNVDPQLPDAERMKHMRTCKYEIHEKLAQQFEFLSEPKNALVHYEKAAEICMQNNLFRLHTQLLEHVERLKD